MADINLKVDISELAARLTEITDELKKDIQDSVNLLAVEGADYVMRQAKSDSKTSIKYYKPDETVLHYPIGNGVAAVAIHEDILWLEDGSDQHDMKPGLLKGKKYRAIPFDFSPGSDRPMEGANKILKDKLVSELKKNKIPYGKIERTADGSPRTGLLHKIDFKAGNPRVKTVTYKSKDQFGNETMKTEKITQGDYLAGVNIYQHVGRKTGKVRRSILTFRTVSVNSPEASWQHPGFEGKKFLDKVPQWIETFFENEVLPKLLEKYK